ncbi:MAG: hypothetical protein Q9P01_01655 [Anaerolineae bacterium]|nr:hypothetical protein [Anaerolineae bacterium]
MKSSNVVCLNAKPVVQIYRTLLQHVAARHQVLDIPPLQAIIQQLWTLLPLLPEVSKGRSAARL